MHHYLRFLIPSLLAAMLVACNDSVFLSPDEIPGDFAPVTVAPGDSAFVAVPFSGYELARINGLGALKILPDGSSNDSGSSLPSSLRAYRTVLNTDQEPSDPALGWNLDLYVRAASKGIWIKVAESLSPYPLNGEVEFQFARGNYFIPLIILPAERFTVAEAAFTDLSVSGSGDVVDETERFTISNTSADTVRVILDPLREAKGTVTFTPSPSQIRIPLASSQPSLRLPVPGADGRSIEWIDALSPYSISPEPLPASLIPSSTVVLRIPPGVKRRFVVCTSFVTLTASYLAVASASGSRTYEISGSYTVKRPTDFVIAHEDL